MGKRAQAVQETRLRIAQATLELHAEQGIAMTSWDQIAARAGVGIGTVYRHFRSLDELLPACGPLTWEKLALPDQSIFEGAVTRSERMRRLVDALFDLYKRGEAELRNIRDEATLHPVLGEAQREVDSRIAALVTAAAVEPRQLVRALTDLGTWQSLRRASVTDPAGTVVRLLEAVKID